MTLSEVRWVLGHAQITTTGKYGRLLNRGAGGAVRRAAAMSDHIDAVAHLQKAARPSRHVSTRRRPTSQGTAPDAADTGDRPGDRVGRLPDELRGGGERGPHLEFANGTTAPK